jgi:predicted TIM-barrel fold metal-dependent hydrolase
VTVEDLDARVLATSGARYAILNCLTMFETQRNVYFQAGLATALNDWLRHEWLDRDDRLRASVVVPWADPDGAVAEIERVADDRRFVQVLLPIRAATRWGQKTAHGIHAAAAECGLAIALHAWGVAAQAPTTTGYTTTYLEDYLSNATTAQQQVASFVAEGVFDRYPDLKVVLIECGFTWLPSLLWRMDKDWRSVWSEIPWVKQRPSHYVRHNMRATTAPAHLGNATPKQIAQVVKMVGSDWLLYASDYPHDHGPSDHRLLDALDESARRAVLADNAAKFYKLNGATANG